MYGFGNIQNFSSRFDSIIAMRGINCFFDEKGSAIPFEKQKSPLTIEIFYSDSVKRYFNISNKEEYQEVYNFLTEMNEHQEGRKLREFEDALALGSIPIEQLLK